ncbi:hypothetical protein ABT389_32570 [Streptomyces bacillaris]|uniref:hypothetical protein n=1 Tax=Streptomyces bacillaris TaxID=68179 RepID=UPI00335CB9CD
MGTLGLCLLLSGGVGLVFSTKGVRGWWNWSRNQRIGATVSAGLTLAGLILLDMNP